MKHIVLFLASTLLASIAAAETAPPAPTPFEAFVQDPNASVIQDQLVGTMNSSDATATVSVMVVENTADASLQMRGIRVDLEDNSGSDRIYMAESELGMLIGELSGYQSDIPRLEEERSSPYSVRGSGRCWMPEPATRTLCPSYRIGPAWTAFTLAAFGGKTFAFPDHEPDDFKALLEASLEALQPRTNGPEPAASGIN